MHDRFGSKRSIIGENQFDICAPAQRAIQLQAADGGEISRLDPESMVVELANRSIGHGRWGVNIKARIILHDSGRLILKPSLVSGHFARLRGTHAAEILLALPTLPGKFV